MNVQSLISCKTKRSRRNLIYVSLYCIITAFIGSDQSSWISVQGYKNMRMVFFTFQRLPPCWVIKLAQCVQNHVYIINWWKISLFYDILCSINSRFRVGAFPKNKPRQFGIVGTPRRLAAKEETDARGAIKIREETCKYSVGEYAVMALFVSCQGIETRFYAINVMVGKEAIALFKHFAYYFMKTDGQYLLYLNGECISTAHAWIYGARVKSTKKVSEHPWQSSRALLTSPLHDRLLIIQVDEVIDKNCDHGSLGFWQMYNLFYAYSCRIKVPARRLGGGCGRMRPLLLAWPARSRLPV